MSRLKSKTTNQKAKANRKNVDMEKVVMEKIESNKIRMRPKWLFAAGSTLAVAGFIGLTAGAMFLTNLTIFLIKKRGPGYGRLELLLDSFPLWIPVLAVIGIVLGIWMLKKYDFSYKKNFLLIIVAFVSSVIIAGLLVDQMGLNTAWSHQGPMRKFYLQIEGREATFPHGSTGRMMRKGQGSGFYNGN